VVITERRPGQDCDIRDDGPADAYWQELLGDGGLFTPVER
jgi:hypothetical protein